MSKRKEERAVQDSKESTKKKTTLRATEPTPLCLSVFMDDLETPEETDTSVVKYPKINSALGTLERFLTKNLMLIIGIYIFAMTLCGGGLLLNNAIFSNASTTTGTSGSADMELNTWLYSFIAIFTFFVLLSVFYLLGRKRYRDKKGIC